MKKNLYSLDVNRLFLRLKEDKLLDFLKENKQLINDFSNKKIIIIFLIKIQELKSILYQINKEILSKENEKVEKKLYSALDDFFKGAEDIQKKVNDTVFLRRLKKLFRDFVGTYIYKSELIKNGYLKSRGYPGDAAIIEAVYNNIPVSSGIGYFLDKFLLNSRYAVAVRNRKDGMKLILKDFLSTSKKARLKILNLACGSCREIRELFNQGFPVDKEIDFVLVDKDKATLEYAKKVVRNLSRKYKFNFYAEDVLEFLRNKQRNHAKYGKFNLIYSIGLADYLPNAILGPLIKHSLAQLSKDGLFVIAHKNLRTYTSTVSDWGADWNFIPRDEKEIQQLIERNCDIDSFNIRCIFDKTKTIFFFLLHRK